MSSLSGRRSGPIPRPGTGQCAYRAFVSIPGHEYDVFNNPTYRAILLRGIAWAGKRTDADEFCTKEELCLPCGIPPEDPSRPQRR